MIDNRKIRSSQASCFHRYKESNKNVTASPEKTCDGTDLPVTTSNITTSPLKTPEALSQSNNPNTTKIHFDIDLDKPIPSSPLSSLLSSDSEKKSRN